MKTESLGFLLFLTALISSINGGEVSLSPIKEENSVKNSQINANDKPEDILPDRLGNKRRYLQRFSQSWKLYAKANDIAKREKLRKALLDALKSMNTKKKSTMTSLTHDSVNRIQHAAHMLKEFRKMYKLSEDVMSSFKEYDQARKNLVEIGKTNTGASILKRYVILRDNISKHYKRNMINKPLAVDDSDIDGVMPDVKILQKVAKDTINKHEMISEIEKSLGKKTATPGTLQIIRLKKTDLAKAQAESSDAGKRFDFLTEAQAAYSKAKEKINELKEKIKAIAKNDKTEGNGASGNETLNGSEKQKGNETTNGSQKETNEKSNSNKKSVLANDAGVQEEALGHVNSEMSISSALRKAEREDMKAIAGGAAAPTGSAAAVPIRNAAASLPVASQKLGKDAQTGKQQLPVDGSAAVQIGNAAASLPVAKQNTLNAQTGIQQLPVEGKAAVQTGNADGSLAVAKQDTLNAQSGIQQQTVDESAAVQTGNAASSLPVAKQNAETTQTGIQQQGSNSAQETKVEIAGGLPGHAGEALTATNSQPKLSAVNKTRPTASLSSVMDSLAEGEDVLFRPTEGNKAKPGDKNVPVSKTDATLGQASSKTKSQEEPQGQQGVEGNKSVSVNATESSQNNGATVTSVSTSQVNNQINGASATNSPVSTANNGAAGVSTVNIPSSTVKDQAESATATTLPSSTVGNGSAALSIPNIPSPIAGSQVDATSPTNVSSATMNVQTGASSSNVPNQVNATANTGDGASGASIASVPSSATTLNNAGSSDSPASVSPSSATGVNTTLPIPDAGKQNILKVMMSVSDIKEHKEIQISRQNLTNGQASQAASNSPVTGTTKSRLTEAKIQSQVVKTIDRQLETLKRLQDAKAARRKFESAKRELQSKVKNLYDMAIAYEKPETANGANGELKTKAFINPLPSKSDQDLHPGVALAGISDKAISTLPTPSNDNDHHGFTLGFLDRATDSLKAHVVDLQPKVEDVKIDKVYQVGLPDKSAPKDDTPTRKSEAAVGDKALKSLTAAINNDLKLIQENESKRQNEKKQSVDLKKVIQPILAKFMKKDKHEEGDERESSPAEEKAETTNTVEAPTERTPTKKSTPTASPDNGKDSIAAKAQDAFKEVEDYLSKALNHVAKEAIAEDSIIRKEADEKEASEIINEETQDSAKVKSDSAGNGKEAGKKVVEKEVKEVTKEEGNKEKSGNEKSAKVEEKKQDEQTKVESHENTTKADQKASVNETDRNEKLRKIVEEAMKEHAKDPKNPHPVDASLINPTPSVKKEEQQSGAAAEAVKALETKAEQVTQTQEPSKKVESPSEKAPETQANSEAITKAEHMEEQVAKLQEKMYSQGSPTETAYKSIDQQKPMFDGNGYEAPETQQMFNEQLHHHHHRHHRHYAEEEEAPGDYDDGDDDEDGDDEDEDDDDDDRDYDDEDDEDNRRKRKKSFMQNWPHYRNYQRDLVASHQAPRKEPEMMNRGMMNEDSAREELEDSKKSTVPKMRRFYGKRMSPRSRNEDYMYTL